MHLGSVDDGVQPYRVDHDDCQGEEAPEYPKQTGTKSLKV